MPGLSRPPAPPWAQAGLLALPRKETAEPRSCLGAELRGQVPAGTSGTLFYSEITGDSWKMQSQYRGVPGTPTRASPVVPSFAPWCRIGARKLAPLPLPLPHGQVRAVTTVVKAQGGGKAAGVFLSLPP